MLVEGFLVFFSLFLGNAIWIGQRHSLQIEPFDVTEEYVDCVGFIVIAGLNLPPELTEPYHLVFVGITVAGCKLLDDFRVDEMWLRKIEGITNLEQNPSELGQLSCVDEVVVYTYIFSNNLPDAVPLDEINQCVAESLVLLVVVTAHGLFKIPCSALLQAKEAGMCGYVKGCDLIASKFVSWCLSVHKLRIPHYF